MISKSSTLPILKLSFSGISISPMFFKSSRTMFGKVEKICGMMKPMLESETLTKLTPSLFLPARCLPVKTTS